MDFLYKFTNLSMCFCCILRNCCEMCVLIAMMMECYAVLTGKLLQTLQSIVMPGSSWSSRPRNALLELHKPEDGDTTLLRNVGRLEWTQLLYIKSLLLAIT
jgi:hypothetical protein